MKILVINCGSSSIKYKLYNMDNRTVLAAGGMEKIGLDDSFLKMKNPDGSSETVSVSITNHEQGINFILKQLTSPDRGVIKSLEEIDAVGHRIVHGGEFTHSVIVTPEILEKWKESLELAPLHNPAHLKGYEAVKKELPTVKQVFVFDTAFHQTMPDYAYTYALPHEICETYKIRRYGFHGTSVRYVSAKACEFLGWDINDKKIIVCHIGNGASLTAVKNGKVIDTSMGLTPLPGLVMGTRCGDVDPMAILFIMEHMNLSTKQVSELINKKSGVLGMSGVSSDMRELDDAINAGNKQALLAHNTYCYSVSKYLGAYTFAMGGLDAIIFTAGVGEHQHTVRRDILKGLEPLGIKLDMEKNDVNFGENQIISSADSKVTVAVIGTDEELLIASDTEKLVKGDC
jgi:acetate kinase